MASPPFKLSIRPIAMTELVVRRLLIDLQAPVARHWCGDDAFRTAFFNALSMSFPTGEQLFIDSVRRGLDALGADRQAPLRAEVQGFIGQEATHRRIHALFNGHLDKQGLVNDWAQRSLARTALLADTDPRHGLAITAATEHFTAIFAQWLLERPQWLDGAEPRLQTMWLWHCAEESEHRSTAFDLYRALGGNEAWRLAWFRRINLIFFGDLARQTVDNLRRDGTLWSWRTWRSAADLLLGRQGLLRRTFAAWREYRRADFHPGRQDDAASRRWLAANAGQFVRVGG